MEFRLKTTCQSRSRPEENLRLPALRPLRQEDIRYVLVRVGSINPMYLLILP